MQPLGDSKSDAGRAELLENLHRFYSERARAMPHGSVTEEPGLLLVIRSGIVNPELNIAFFVGEPPDAPRALRRAVDLLGPTGAWRFEVPAPIAPAVTPLARELGLEGPEPRPALTLVPSALVRASPPPDFSVRMVTTPDERRTFYRTVMTGFTGRPLPWTTRIPKIDVQGATLLLGSHAGTPVAAATLFVTGRIAGVYGVATVATARRSGFGRAVSEAAVSEGFRRGCDLAFLQSSSMAYSVYTAMGFAPAFDHSLWYARP